MFDSTLSRRDFLRAGTAGLLASTIPDLGRAPLFAQEPGERPMQSDDVKIVTPRGRVPISFIIDDSTCLANLAHFGIPQFAEVYPDRYHQDWAKLPKEIPDKFVRKFGEWSREHGVKGKYSIVPYPAGIGRIDQKLPDWSKQQLEDSLKLVREFMTVDWDIHPEMVTHTFAIDLKTDKPYPDHTEKFLESAGFSVGKNAEQLAEYMAYALRILKNVGLTCEGVTTPGSFGNKVRDALSRGTLMALRDIDKAEIPHYFRHSFTGEDSVAPRVEYASGLNTDDPKCCVSIVGCTADWFGGFDGLTPGTVDQFITEDLEEGRMVDVIERGDEPAIMVSHWPGLYFNGDETGFAIFQDVIRRLHRRYDNLHWMKLSEIARYWAAKELTHIERKGDSVILRSPFTCPDFTFEIELPASAQIHAKTVGSGRSRSHPIPLKQIVRPLDLASGEWVHEEDVARICLNLPKREDVVVSWE